MIRKYVLQPLKEKIESDLLSSSVGGVVSNAMDGAEITIANSIEDKSQASKVVILDCHKWAPDRGSMTAGESKTWVDSGYDAQRLVRTVLSVRVKTVGRWTSSSILSILYLYFSEFGREIGKATGLMVMVREVNEPRRLEGLPDMFEGALVLEALVPIDVTVTPDDGIVRAISLTLMGDETVQDVSAG